MCYVHENLLIHIHDKLDGGSGANNAYGDILKIYEQKCSHIPTERIKNMIMKNYFNYFMYTLTCVV